MYNNCRIVYAPTTLGQSGDFICDGYGNSYNYDSHNKKAGCKFKKRMAEIEKRANVDDIYKNSNTLEGFENRCGIIAYDPMSPKSINVTNSYQDNQVHVATQRVPGSIYLPSPYLNKNSPCWEHGPQLFPCGCGKYR